MQPFEILTAVAAPLDEQNIDTDQLVPARFLLKSRADGYAQYLFFDRRFDAGGKERPEFILNQGALPGGENHRQRCQFRLRLVARACGLGVDGIRYSRCYRTVVRSYIFRQ